MAAPEQWQITLRGPDGRRYRPRHVWEDVEDPEQFRGHLLAIARIEDPMETDSGENWVGNYELEVAKEGEAEPRFVFRWKE